VVVGMIVQGGSYTQNLVQGFFYGGAADAAD